MELAVIAPQAARADVTIDATREATFRSSRGKRVTKAAEFTMFDGSN